MPTRPLNQQNSPPVPLEYAGKWIAWNANHSKIEASANSLPELWKTVDKLRIVDPVLEKVLRADVRFVGMR